MIFSHTWRRSRPERAGAAARAIAVEVCGFVGIDPLTIHLMWLSGFFQLGQNKTTTSLRWSIHLKHLKRQYRNLSYPGIHRANASHQSHVTRLYLEAQLLGTSIHCSSLSYSSGTCDQHCVTQHVLSILGVVLSTVPVRVWRFKKNQ